MSIKDSTAKRVTVSAGMMMVALVTGMRNPPSPGARVALAIAIARRAAGSAVLHELLCCFVWHPLTAWWIGLRSDVLRGRACG